MMQTTGRPLAARISTAPLTVGDPVVVHVSGALPPGATLVDAVARVRDTLPDGLRVLSADSLRVASGVVSGQLRVAFFRPDSQTIPSLVIAYRTGSGTDTLVSAPISLLVHPVLPTGNATLHDVRDVDAPWPVQTVSLAIGIALIVWLAFRWLRPRRSISVPSYEPSEPQPSAYDLAIARLREIERDGLTVEERYAKAADVVRGYIAATRGVPALERTTPEIVKALGTNGSLESFLREADLVKFAGLKPPAYRARAREVIDALR